MKPGPKGIPTGAPLHLSSLPKSGSARVIAFIERYIRTPKGTGAIAAKSKVKLLAWQVEAIEGIYDGDRPRQALISISRKNGKTFLAACLALYHLLADGEESAEVIIASSDERTAMVTYNLIRRMIELEPRLSSILHVHKDRITHPATDSVIEVLSGDANRAQGRNPSLALLDEVHVSSPEMWDALALGMAARKSPLMLGISTEGPPDEDNLMTRLVTHGREGSDPDFYFQEHTAPAGCAVDDESAWAEANPGLGHTVTVEHLRALVKTTRESQWRRYHLNQRVAIAGAWMPPGAWEACTEPKTIKPGTEIVLALDGSFTGDCTALLGATVSPRPHLFVLGLWQPSTEEPVDILEVEEVIRKACRRYKVRELIADPYGWSRTLQVLRSERINAVEHPQSAARMTPATVGLYEAVMNHQVTHDGGADLTRHVHNAVVKEDVRGTRISKPAPKSARKIDLAVCACMGWARGDPPGLDASAHEGGGVLMRIPTDTFELATVMGRRLDGAQGHLQRWLQYYDGTQPGAFMSPESAEALSGRLPTLNANFCRLAVLSLQERLRITGFLLDGATEPDPDIWASWMRSGMDRGSDAVHVDSQVFGRAYGQVWVDDYGDPLLSAESPLTMTTINDPVTGQTIAALKRYWLRPDPDQPNGQGIALLMVGDRVKVMTTQEDLPGYPPMSGGWSIVEDLPNPAGRPPVVCFLNGYGHSSLNSVEGQSELSDLAPLVDAIAKLGQDLMVSSEVAARPRRWATGLQLMPKKNPETGEDILDEDGETVFENPFSNEASRVWMSEEPGTRFGTFAAGDLSSYGQAIQTLTSQVGAISTLPAHYLGMFGDQPPSADSIRAAEASITSRAIGKIRSLTPAWAEFASFEVALRTGRDPASVQVIPQWATPETRTQAQDVDAAAKLIGVGVPLEVVLRDELGWNEDQLKAVREARLTEAIDRAATSPVVPPARAQVAP